MRFQISGFLHMILRVCFKIIILVLESLVTPWPGAAVWFIRVCQFVLIKFLLGAKLLATLATHRFTIVRCSLVVASQSSEQFILLTVSGGYNATIIRFSSRKSG